MVGLSQFGICLPECLPDKRSLGMAPLKAPPKWLVLELLVEEIKDFNHRSRFETSSKITICLYRAIMAGVMEL
jgi:hypothetical protein